MTESGIAKAASAARLLELISVQRISQSIYVAASLGIADLLAILFAVVIANGNPISPASS